MILTADVYAAFERLWNASTAAKLVPGGLWEGRPSGAAGSGQDSAPGMYAVLEVAEGDKLWTSGAVYVAHYEVTLTVWAAAGLTVNSPVQAALWGILNRDRAANLVVRSAEKTLDAVPGQGSLKKDGPKKNARDVTVAAMKWDVVLQGER